jgi:hypothetical protein
MSRSYTSSPPCASMVCNGTAYLYLITVLFNGSFNSADDTAWNVKGRGGSGLI